MKTDAFGVVLNVRGPQSSWSPASPQGLSSIHPRKEAKIYKIRVTGEVLEIPDATRRVDVDGQMVTFRREPVYVRAAELPQLADDPYLRIETVDSALRGAGGPQVLGRAGRPWERRRPAGISG